LSQFFFSSNFFCHFSSFLFLFILAFVKANCFVTVKKRSFQEVVGLSTSQKKQNQNKKKTCFCKSSLLCVLIVRTKENSVTKQKTEQNNKKSKPYRILGGKRFSSQKNNLSLARKKKVEDLTKKKGIKKIMHKRGKVFSYYLRAHKKCLDQLVCDVNKKKQNTQITFTLLSLNESNRTKKDTKKKKKESKRRHSSTNKVEQIETKYQYFQFLIDQQQFMMMSR
jgi:hypothetical protein